jgi:hypothetical protein
MRAATRPFYPFLLAAWPALALAAQNPDEIGGVADLAIPIAFGLAAAAAGWLLAATLTRDAYRRAAVAAACVAWWWGFRTLVNAARVAPLGPDGLAVWWAVGLLAAAAFIMLRRLPPKFAGATRFLNLLSVFLLLLPTASLFVRKSGGGHVQSSATAPPLPHTLAHGVARPSVYLVILDGYTGRESLARHYGFDNRAFEEALEQRGFVLPARFRANYTGTTLAVSAILNWDYIQSFAPELEKVIDRGSIIPFTEESRTWRFFAQAGYHILYVPAYLGMSGRNRYASARFTPEETDFSVAWRAMTPISSATRWLRRHGVGVRPIQDESAQAKVHDRRFEVIAEAARLREPVFAFGHFLLPHEPYVYASDCGHLEQPIWPWHDRTIPMEVDTRAYLDQLSCTNRKVLDLVDRIFAESQDPPIVLLLSDHGRSSMRFGVLPLEQTSERDVVERLDNFGAFFVPAPLRDTFRNTRTPVGAMRTLMRGVFGVPLPELEEASYWSSTRRPFAFEKVDWPEESQEPRDVRRHPGPYGGRW